jgi:hypothetical protein
MRNLGFIALVLLGGCSPRREGSSVHVDPLPRLPNLDGPRASLDWYLATVSRATDSMGLGALRSGQGEIRLWWSFYLGGGPHLLQLRLHENHWIALHLPADQAADTVGLERRIQMAIQHMDRLAVLQQGTTGGIVVTDGGWYVLEWSLKGQIHRIGADNPSSFCTDYDRELLAAVKVLAPGRASDADRCQGAT